MRFLLVLTFCAAACGSAQRPQRKTDGAITGLTRDADSAEPLGAADIVAKRPNAPDVAGVSGKDGVYTLDHLAPGRYTLVGTYAGQTITATNVVVDAGEATYVDVQFTPSRPDPFIYDFSGLKRIEIKKYRTKDGRTLLDGMVTDAATGARIPGAVVTVVGPTGPMAQTLQTVTSDDGRYKFEPIPTGEYVVSAYYSVGGHGQIEVRRSDIHIEAGDDVEVPLLIETTKVPR
ncbi:MAG TPA: carboxypeptidase-like regulatory domain-containing protein [Kofleriaceae bacterium]|nr:carboxypeptidase-like regulatory domain-containing protein [Kofleriaceae bacterium]